MPDAISGGRTDSCDGCPLSRPRPNGAPWPRWVVIELDIVQGYGLVGALLS